MGNYVVILGLFFVTCPVFGLIYHVKKGDTLSAISKMYRGDPIYSKNGSLEEILALNPQIQNPDLIYPNQEITIPGDGSMAKADSESSEAANSQLDPESSIPSQSDVSIAGNFFSNVHAPANDLTATLSLSYLRIDSTDGANGGSATFLSSLNPGVTLGWNQKWSDAWQTRMSGTVMNAGWKSPASQSLRPSNQVLGGVELGGGYQISERFFTIASFGVQQMPFVHGSSAVLLDLEAVLVPYFHAGVDYDFLKMEHMTFGVSLGAHYFLPSSGGGIEANSGFGHYSKVYLLCYTFNPLQMLGEVIYSRDYQGSSLASQTLAQLGFALGIKWRVGEGL
jgi:hypothetical protein